MIQDIYSKLTNPTVCDTDFRPVDRSDDVKALFAELHELGKTDRMFKKLFESLRLQLYRFTVTTAQKPNGSSYTNVMGCNIIGNSYADLHSLTKKPKIMAKRYTQQELYAKACLYGLNKYIADKSFTHTPDENYEDFDQACLAMEVEASSKKGPFDGGDEFVALNTIHDLLAGGANVQELDPEVLNYFKEHALKRTMDELADYVDRGFKYAPEHYVDRLVDKKISKTYRGFPFQSTGNVTLNYQQAYITRWMFAGFLDDWLPDSEKKFNSFVERRLKVWLARYSAETHPDGSVAYRDSKGRYVTDKYTIDRFIQDVLCELKDRNIYATQWITASMKHTFVCPISRHQGSPWSVKWSRKGELVLGDQKDPKYRAVIPCSGFAQAMLIVATMDLIDNVPKTPCRIGLQDPATNVSRMNEFIRNANEVLLSVLVSTDFTAYDTRLLSQLMIGNTVGYSTIYDDPWIKDAMIAAGFILSQKIAIFPTPVNSEDQVYNAYLNEQFNEIKGSKVSEYLRSSRSLNDGKQKTKLLSQLTSQFDYRCTMFYLYKTWLISGIVLTNTIGSHCTAELGRDLCPYIITHDPECAAHILNNQVGHHFTSIQEVQQWLSELWNNPDTKFVAIASGDDCVNSIPAALFDVVGYDGVLHLLEMAYAKCNMVVNSKKQLRTKFLGYPVVDFLQNVYPQGFDPRVPRNVQPYTKITRGWFGMPYKERFSKLPLVFQYTSVEGRLNAYLCDKNLELAAYIAYYGGKFYHDACVKYRLPVDVRRDMWNANDPLVWDKKYAIPNTQLLGLDWYFGLVKRYGQSATAEITRRIVVDLKSKYAKDESKFIDKAGRLAEDIRQDLELRAPHREGYEQIVFSKLDPTTADALGIDRTNQSKTTFRSLIPSLVTEIEKRFKVNIIPVELPAQSTVMAETDWTDDGPDATGLDDSDTSDYND